jgi:hypothetical protein
MIKNRLIAAPFIAGTYLAGSAVSFAAANKPPRLALQITVDALRGDLPERYVHVLGEGGFR